MKELAPGSDGAINRPLGRAPAGESRCLENFLFFMTEIEEYVKSKILMGMTARNTSGYKPSVFLDFVIFQHRQKMPKTMHVSSSADQ
jgi:hypothetical protein